MEKQKKSVGAIALVVLLLIVTIVSLVLATYAWAKYTTTVDNSSNPATAVVAKWDVNANSQALTWSKDFTHVVESRLAPGTNGTIPINFSAGTSEVDVRYTMTLVSSSGKPTNLKFYTTRTGAGTSADPYVFSNEVAATNGTIATGTIAHGDSARTANTTLYWNWPYDNSGVSITRGEEGNEETVTGDQVDTEEGVAAGTMSVVIRIDAVQVQPE